MNRIGLLVLVGGIPFACSPLSSVEKGSRLHVAGGQPLPETQRDARGESVVVLLDGSGLPMCAGAVLGSDVILTSASCAKNEKFVKVGFGRNVGALAFSSTVANRKIHESYTVNAGGSQDDAFSNDLAVVRLQEKLPEAARPLALRTSSLQSGESLWTSGYGTTSPTAGDAGVLRQAQFLVRKTYESRGTVAVRGADGELPCNGDKGSPVFSQAEGALVLAGITSFGFDDSCDVMAFVTDVSKYADWIQTALHAVRGPATAPVPPMPAPLIADSDLPWCRSGFEFNPSTRLCESEAEATGPFTEKMIQGCLEHTNGDDSCNGSRWDLELARGVRGSGVCPQGAVSQDNLCIEGEFAYGPFPASAVYKCIQDGRRGEVCYSGRWSVAIAKSYVSGAGNPPPSQPPAPRPTPTGPAGTVLADASTIPLPAASEEIWCYPGFRYNSSSHLCESDREALGHFTDRMVGRCIQELRGDPACNNILWDKNVARGFRGNGTCPDGSSLREGLCVEGEDAFGPFPSWAVRKCVEQRNGKSCFLPRWSFRVARAIYAGRPGAGGGQENGDVETGKIPVGAYTFSTVTTGYSTENTLMEGGHLDAQGNRLNTLKDYLAGRVPYVSVAMDDGRDGNPRPFPYGTYFRIPTIEREFGKVILFKLVDTGGAFAGKGKSRMDICMGNGQGDIARYPFISGKTEHTVWVVAR